MLMVVIGMTKSPFHIACKNGYIEIVRLLLYASDRKINYDSINHLERTPFFSACSEGHIDIVKLLLSDDRITILDHPDNTSHPLLLFLVWYKTKYTEQLFKLLLDDDRIDINKRDNDNKSLLSCCSNKKNEALFEILINHPRLDSFQINDAFRSTTDSECLKMLMDDNRCDINCTNKDSQTRLHTACITGKENIIEILLADPRIKLDQIDNHGNTFIHYAYNSMFKGFLKAIVESKKVPRSIMLEECDKWLDHLENE